MQDRLCVVLCGAFVLVGFDRADIGRLGLHQIVHKRIGTRFDPVTCRRRPFLAVGIGPFRKEADQECIGRAVHEVQNVFEQGVLVLLCHALDVVHDITCIVPDKELGSTGLEVWIAREHGRALHERVVGCR